MIFDYNFAARGRITLTCEGVTSAGCRQEGQEKLFSRVYDSDLRKCNRDAHDYRIQAGHQQLQRKSLRLLTHTGEHQQIDVLLACLRMSTDKRLDGV